MLQTSLLAFTRLLTRLALPPSFADEVGVCGTIPQRNCGRFSRPSLTLKRAKNANVAEAPPPAAPKRALFASRLELGKKRAVAGWEEIRRRR